MKTALQWHAEEQAEAARAVQAKANQRLVLAEYERRLRSCKLQLFAWSAALALCVLAAAVLLGRLGR